MSLIKAEIRLTPDQILDAVYQPGALPGTTFERFRIDVAIKLKASYEDCFFEDAPQGQALKILEAFDKLILELNSEV